MKYLPVSDAQDLLKSTQAAPETVIGVHQTAACLAVLASTRCIPAEAAHEICNAQACRPAHSCPAVHQHACNSPILSVQYSTTWSIVSDCVVRHQLDVQMQLQVQDYFLRSGCGCHSTTGDPEDTLMGEN